MGHSKADKAKSRERILSTASKMVREAGLTAVSVGELMKAAELTHGGFYGHFDSRDGMLAAALDRALSDGEAASSAGERGRGTRTVKSILNGYLSSRHRDDPSAGCAISALAGDVARGSPELKAIMTAKLDRYMGNMAEAFGDHPEAEAFAQSAWATMVGAVILARVYEGTPLADQMLANARKAVLELESHLKSATTGA